ncbi:alkaline phosphatase PhoX [Shinella yambaruensis]|uniref:PhoX family protein n=1 Tax=Shinella yambaruensis TaxID=415996 RepID=UPI003D797CA5
MTETLRNAAAMHAERHPRGGLGYAHAIVRGLGNLLGRRSAAAGQAPEKAPASTADRAASHRRAAAAGCLTPWGTRLMAEVDLHDDAAGPSGAPAGWIVEVDPQDPDAAPKRRTALGRLGHRGLSCLVNGDGRVVVYCGDGGGSGHLYKFITHGTWQPGDRTAGRDLLDDGTLFVAHFAADGEEDGMPVVFDAAPLVMEHGTLAWMPVVAGKRPLTAAYGYAGPAGVRTETRRAAALLRATRMDGITDVTADPEAGTARLRLAGRQTDARSRFNHVIEITEAGGDAAALRAHWEVLSTRSGH